MLILMTFGGMEIGIVLQFNKLLEISEKDGIKLLFTEVKVVVMEINGLDFL